ncbi:MAG: hypothetical protein J5685_05435, partial [Clostridiales bacterium]|nr:hypothetical protein [Clostridiales bacterium]
MKKLKSVVALVLVGASMMSLAGCAKKIEPLKKKDFKDALENALDIDDDDYSDYDGSDYDNVWYYEDKYFIDYYQYDDEDDAADWFEDVYDDYEDMIDDKDFSGRHRAVYN